MEIEAGNNMPDPVSSLWRCFRAGEPLIVIYNASKPAEGDLQIDYTKVAEKQVPKKATYSFIQAAKTRWSIPDQDAFILQDLYGDNTTGFVKVSILRTMQSKPLFRDKDLTDLAALRLPKW